LPSRENLSESGVDAMSLLRVLVVDDNEDAAETLATLFDLVGCETRTEYDGAAGLDAAREFRPDACVLDIHMPGMNGCELAKVIRAERGDGVRLLALTGVTGGAYDERIAEAGFDARFAKPADLPALLKVVVPAAGPV
jgi:CheY-like chemotaxis protein